MSEQSQSLIQQVNNGFEKIPVYIILGTAYGVAFVVWSAQQFFKDLREAIDDG